MMAVLFLIAGFLVLAALLARPPRRMEGLLLAYLLPTLVFFAYVTWHSKTASLEPGVVNINEASAAEIAQATGIPLDIADRVVAVRERQGQFTSVSAVPDLGSASEADRADLERLVDRKDWRTLRKIAQTGRIPESARPGLVGAIVRAVEPGEKRGSGLFPALDLRVRAAQALPEQEVDLRRSPRAVLIGFLQNEAAADRVIQFRTCEWRSPGEALRISDVPAVPRATVVLRTRAQALSLYWKIVGALALVVLAMHFYLRARAPRADQLLLPLLGALGLLGVVMLFSVSSPLRVSAAIPGIPMFLGRAQPKYVGQALAVLLGLAALPFAYCGVRFIERSATQEVIALAAVAPLAANAFARWGAGAVPAILICAAAAAGLLYRLNRRGSARYVAVAALIIAGLAAGRLLAGRSGYAPFIEFAKLALIVYTARLCAEHDFFFGGKLRSLPSSAVVQFVSVWAVALVVTMLARDMGVLLLLWMPCVLLIGFAFSRREVIAGVALLFVGAVIIRSLGLGPFPDRVAMWLNPWSYTPAPGHAFSGQMAQAFHRMASVSSPIAGLGLGRGTPADFAANTQDLVMPLYFEQLGFVGVALVVCIFIAIIYRLFKIGMGARDRFAHWLGLGTASTFAVQTVYVLGANFGAWPLTGVTLAPLAFGKAACLGVFVMVWVALGISGTADAPAGFVPDKRKRTAAWVFAITAVLALYATGKALKVGVLDRDPNALAHYGPRHAMNSRIAARLAVLPHGRILARTNSASYHETKVLAWTRDPPLDRSYSLGPAAWPVVGVSCGCGTTGGELDWRSRLTGAYALVQEGPAYGSPENVLGTALLSAWRAEHHPLWPVRSEWEDRLRPRDVQTTIISSLQQEAYRRLSDYLSGSVARSGNRTRKGAILIADVRTGEYLAKVQFPSVDPNALTSGWAAWDRFATDPAGYLDPNGQIIDIVEGGDRAPGSSAKLNTIMALLAAGEGSRRFWCGPGVRVNGHKIHDFGGASHGWVDAERIIKYSCNRGAAQAAEAVGPERLLALYRQKLRYRLPHMSSPAAAFRASYDQIAFGQAISASLKELMATVCAIARGGEAVELHLVRKRPDDVERWRVCSDHVASALTRYMISAAKPGGTAYTVYQEKVAWPSKTGSAEVEGAKKTDAWFAGFAPAEKPRVAFVLWVEEDGTGGNMARNIGVVSLIGRALAATTGG